MEPDVTGMTQEPQTAFEERLQKIETPKARTDQNDTLYIKNIDEGCSEETFSTIRISERWRDPETGRVVTRFKDENSVFSHADGFTVKWSGQPFTIKPGEIMRMPRFLGEHFASKLADHLLDKQGVHRMLRNDPVARPRILKEIIIKEEPFAATVTSTVGAETQLTVDALNQDEHPVAMPEYSTGGQKGVELAEDDATPKERVSTTVGDMRTSQIESTEDVISRLGTETPEDSLNVPDKWQSHSKVDLIKLVRDMVPDYKFGTAVTKAQLVGILQRM